MSRKQKKMEKKQTQLRWFYFEDGVWDLYFGLAAVCLGLVIRLHSSALWMLVVVPLLGLPLWLKEKLILPHLSQLKIQVPKRKGILGMGVFLLAVIIALVFVFKDQAGFGGVFSYIGENALVMAAIFSGSLTWFLAYAFGFRRLYLYGVLIFAAVFMDAWLFSAQPWGLAFFAGLIIIGSAASVFTQFLRMVRK